MFFLWDLQFSTHQLIDSAPLQNSSSSVVTGTGTSDPNPLGSRRCMAIGKRNTEGEIILEFAC